MGGDAARVEVKMAVWKWVSDHLAALVAAAVLVSSLMNRKKLAKLSVDINGRLTQLLELKGSESQLRGHTEGMKEGREAGLSERRDRVVESERVEDRIASKETSTATQP